MSNSFIFRGNDYSELFKNFDLKKHTKCICCNSKKLEVCSCSDGFTSNICNDCNFIFMNPQLDKNGIKEFYENVYEDIKLINEKINSKKLNKTNNNISPPFFENMMSLIFEKQ